MFKSVAVCAALLLSATQTVMADVKPLSDWLRRHVAADR